MTRAAGMKAAAISYVLLYNVMFIVPLLGILAMTYFGMRSETPGEHAAQATGAYKSRHGGVLCRIGCIGDADDLYSTRPCNRDDVAERGPTTNTHI